MVIALMRTHHPACGSTIEFRGQYSNYCMPSNDRKGQTRDSLKARDWLLRLSLLYSKRP